MREFAYDPDPIAGDPEQAEGSALDLKVLVLYGVARSRVWIVLFTILGAIAGLVAAASQPNTYTSHARLQLRSGLREAITPESVAAPEEDLLHAQGMIDEVFLLDDPEIYRRAALRLGPVNVLMPGDPTVDDTAGTPGPIRMLHEFQAWLFRSQGGAHEECVDEPCEGCIDAAGATLRAKTELEPYPRSSVIDVRHEAASPELAQTFCAALVEEFIARHREEFSAVQHFEQTQQKMLEARDATKQTLETYQDHKKLCGFMDLDSEKTNFLTEKAELESAIRRDQARLYQVQAERDVLDQILQEVPKEIEEVVPPVLEPNPVYQMWDRQKLELIVQKVGGLRSQQEEIESRIARIDEILAGTERFVEVLPEGQRLTPNPEYVDLKRRIDTLAGEELGLGRSIETYRENLRATNSKLSAANECERHHDSFEAAIRESRRLEDELSSMNAKLEVLSNLDTQGQSNLRVYQAALLPRGKDGPQRTKTLLMGVVGGLGLGVGLAVLRQLLDPHVRYPRSVERSLGLRLLGVVPEVRALKKLGQQRDAVAL